MTRSIHEYVNYYKTYDSTPFTCTLQLLEMQIVYFSEARFPRITGSSVRFQYAICAWHLDTPTFKLK